MNKDYYKILGVERSASQDDIKKAFRKLAHEHHPDKHKGDDTKFKEISEAYSVLGDPQKRTQYDRFGNYQAAGGQGFGGFNGQGFDFDFSQFGGFNGQDFEFDLGDILGQFFGGGRTRTRKGRNIRTSINISFKESVFGTEKEINIGLEKVVIKIPPGISDGETLRVAGKGEKNSDHSPDGRPGDLLITVQVSNTTQFRKEGYHLITSLPIKLSTALLGGEQKIETLDGALTLKIPEGIGNGELLRVRQKGVPNERGKRGDLFVKVEIPTPKKLSREAKRIIEDLKKEGI